MSNLHDRGTLRGTLQRNSGNYDDLINKPAINGHALIGYQSGHALGLANEDDIIYVEANPLGPATADLHKILVDDTIYSIPDVVVYGTASGAIASFDDGGDNKSLKSLKVAINPVQDLHGYDHPWAGGAGNNKVDLSQVTAIGSTTVVKDVESIVITASSQYVGAITPKITIPEGTNSLFLYVGTNGKRVEFRQYDENGVPIGTVEGFGSSPISNVTAVRSGAKTCDIIFSNATTTGTAITFSNIMVAFSSTAIPYEPYSNICPISGWDEAEIHRADGATPHIIDDTYNIIWSEAGEVFGGTLDVTNGKLKARPYYASYNGETLIGPWISSMDVYAPNTPPTTGAQVVDLGGVETEIDISPTQITTLLGNNNIWSDTGEIEECVYQRDINIALNKALNQ